ncbi:MAG: hypothetical protein AAF821_08090 [Cyanobacteria bacterium P01_D01_bin.156]
MLLLQGPYVQYQVAVKQVTKTALGRYVKSTVREAMGQLQGQRRKKSSSQEHLKQLNIEQVR